MMTSVWILILYSSNNQNFPLQNWNSTKLVDWKEQKGNRCYYHYFNSLLCNTTALLYGSCIAKIHPQLLVPKAFWKIAHNYWRSHAAYFKPILTICRSTIWRLFPLQLPPPPHDPSQTSPPWPLPTCTHYNYWPSARYLLYGWMWTWSNSNVLCKIENEKELFANGEK